MKICFITTMLFKDGGVSRVLSVLASELSRYYDVTVLSFEDPNNEDRTKYNLSENVKVDFMKFYYKKCYLRRACHKINQTNSFLNKLNKESLWDIVYLPKKMQKEWREYIEQNNFDAVIAVQGKMAFILGSIADDLSCKTIGWQHNSYEAYFENKGNYYWNQDFLFKKYLPYLDRYVVLNEHDEKMIREKMGIDAITIYNPRSFVSEKKAELKNRRFIGVGGLRPAKGFDLLIESFDIFVKHNKDWVLDIYGEGDDHTFLQSLIDKKGLGNRIKLRGVTDNIRGEMLESSALLLSSRWEGMPMVVLEALETGLPTVSYNITAIEPLITNDIEGYIVKQFDTVAFADAMRKIAASQEIRQELSKNALKKSEKFDIELIVKQWEEIFNN